VNLRWSNKNALPEKVRVAMHDMMPACLDEAARTEDPGDGNMVFLGPEKNIDGGMYDGGWTLQSSFVQDVRFCPVPYITIHAYHESQAERLHRLPFQAIAKGGVSHDVIRSTADRRFLAMKRLEMLEAQRKELDAAIVKQRSKLVKM
jgi:hypothetical protein